MYVCSYSIEMALALSKPTRHMMALAVVDVCLKISNNCLNLFEVSTAPRSRLPHGPGSGRGAAPIAPAASQLNPRATLKSWMTEAKVEHEGLRVQ